MTTERHPSDEDRLAGRGSGRGLDPATVAAARRGDPRALAWLRDNGPAAATLRRIQALEREATALRAAFARLPMECQGHIMDHGGGGEAWVDACVLCGHVVLS